MGVRFFALLVCLWIAISVTAKADDPANVILITWDGVRWEEMFEGEDAELGGTDGTALFMDLKARVGVWPGEGAALLGDQVTSKSKISNPVGVSLPAYFSIMAGKTTGCLSNECKRIRHETLPEAYLRLSGEPRSRAAVFGSWSKIGLAAEHEEGSAVVNAGFTPMVRPDSLEPDETMARLNSEQVTDAPAWGDARYDRYTWAQATHYLREYRPGFLFISLNDSDEWGHRNRYPEYLQTLHQYEQWLIALISELKGMGDYGSNTLVIVTTDHGRGKGSHWTNHHTGLGNSSKIWIFAEDLGGKGRISELASSERVNHKDLRGIVEHWLGL